MSDLRRETADVRPRLAPWSFPGWRLPSPAGSTRSVAVVRGGGERKRPSAVGGSGPAPTDDSGHDRAGGDSAGATRPGLTYEPPAGLLAEVPLRGSRGTSVGSAGDPPLPAEMVALLRGCPAPGQRHLSVVPDPPEREPAPGEACSCGMPAAVVFLTERFGDVASCRR